MRRSPKDRIKTFFPGFAALCDRQRMVADLEEGGMRGEWSVLMRSTRFQLSIGMGELLPDIWIKARHGQKGQRSVGILLEELGLWNHRELGYWKHGITRENESSAAKILEANLDVILERLENGPV